MMATRTSPRPLRDLMRYNGSLFVNPLLGTPRHLDFVGCQFQDNTASDERDYKADEDQRGTSPGDAEEMATNLCHSRRHHSLVNILGGEEHAFAKTGRGSPFYFAGRPVHRPQYTVFHRRGKPQEHFDQRSPPLVGYFHYNLVNGDRRRMFEPCPGPLGSLNWIGARILEKKLAKITPKNWIEDQYFVCILLAVAQVQERKLAGPKPASYISRLMVTHVSDGEWMLFYEAEITAELLEVLKSPKTATTYRPWPTIRRKKILYKPYNTFADRLTAELVAPTSSSHKRSTISDSVIKRRLEDESSKTYKRRRMVDEPGKPQHE